MLNHFDFVFLCGCRISFMLMMEKPNRNETFSSKMDNTSLYVNIRSTIHLYEEKSFKHPKNGQVQTSHCSHLEQQSQINNHISMISTVQTVNTVCSVVLVSVQSVQQMTGTPSVLKIMPVVGS